MMFSEMFYTEAQMTWTGFEAESVTANVLRHNEIKNLGQKDIDPKEIGNAIVSISLSKHT